MHYTWRQWFIYGFATDIFHTDSLGGFRMQDVLMRILPNRPCVRCLRSLSLCLCIFYALHYYFFHLEIAFPGVVSKASITHRSSQYCESQDFCSVITREWLHVILFVQFKFPFHTQLTAWLFLPITVWVMFSLFTTRADSEKASSHREADRGYNEVSCPRSRVSRGQNCVLITVHVLSGGSIKWICPRPG